MIVIVAFLSPSQKTHDDFICTSFSTFMHLNVIVSTSFLTGKPATDPTQANTHTHNDLVYTIFIVPRDSYYLESRVRYKRNVDVDLLMISN